MIKKATALIAATLIFASPAYPDNAKSSIGMISGLNGCVSSAQNLEKPYKDRFQNHCFQVAFELCSSETDPTECLLKNVAAIDDQTDKIINRLPKTVSAPVFQKSYYLRTLEEIRRSKRNDACTSPDKYEKAICNMRDASLRLIDAFNLADIAEILE